MVMLVVVVVGGSIEVTRDLEPCWRVGEWRGRLAQLTHPPAGNPPLSGVLPLCSVGRTQ